jgi:hypothetical protein
MYLIFIWARLLQYIQEILSNGEWIGKNCRFLSVLGG